MRKQSFQSRHQQLAQQLLDLQDKQKQSLSVSGATIKGRPLSISSISSAASSGSSSSANSSANSSASSGIQSSLTRNGSLNYGPEYRRCVYLASIESLNSSHHSGETQGIEEALKSLNLTPAGQFKDAAARAAILAAGAQSRGFGLGSPGQRISRINRSLHASLRYDKNTAYRIHLMANARSSLNRARENEELSGKQLPRSGGGNISRNNSSTSSDSGHHPHLEHNLTTGIVHNSRFACRCGSTPSITSSSSSASQVAEVVAEIIETERTYVDDMEQIVTGYLCYLRNVLKQQKHQQSQSIDLAQKPQQVPDSTAMVIRTDDDDKSMLVFDDDTTSATNELEDYDVEEADNEMVIKQNMMHHNMNVKHAEVDKDDGAIMTANHIKNLFSNLEDIYKFNKDLLFRLEECYLNPSSIAECFVENAPGFEVYTHYCTMYPQVVSTLTELMANATSAQLLKERQIELNQSLPLGAYLLKPVQRILKYHILFKSLIKHTTDDDTVSEKDRQLIGKAFSVMTSIACHINDMKKRHEHAIRVQEVQGLLNGWEGPDLTTLGELILEDTFKLYNRQKSSRHLFLFENVLLITKKKRDGSLYYKGHIACSNLMLIEKIEGQPLVFNTVPFDNPKALCAFQAKHLDKKREWCLQMKDVIIKSFEVKIPVHVRDILMSLTN